MTEHPHRRTASWQDDARGGLRSILLEVLVVAALIVLAVALAWVAVTVT